MTAKRLLRLIMLLIVLPVSGAFATENTPIETFIKHVAETNRFVPISNIWQPDELFDKSAMLQKVSDAQPLTISYDAINSLLQANHTAISLVVPGLHGTTYTIDLAQYKFFASNFEVHAKGENNVDSVVSYTPGLYYSGVVHGIPGSVASFSFFKNEVYGVFSIPGVGNFNVVPNTMVGKYYNYNQHYVLFNDNDLKIKEHAPKCATDQLPTPHRNSTERTTTTPGNNVYNNCTEVRVFEVGDYALYLTKGSSITNVTNFLTSLFNNQATIYRNEGIIIVMGYLQVDNASDAWHGITTANSSLFLNKFGYITGNVLHGCDLAILASTCLNGGYGALGGVAWVKELCASYYAPDSAGAYAFCDLDNSGVTAFPTFSWDVEVMCHEMGHVVGSPHTHRCCWNPPARNTAIDGCYTIEGSCAIPSPAYPTAGGTIMSYCHLVSAGINFANGFGPQPGDTIRYFIAYQHSHISGCGATYTPTVALASANRTLSANRECTDLTSGITYYWNDHNTAAQTDDTLVLMIKKNSNNIGNLNTSGFSVSANTIVRWGTGVGDTITSFPAGTPGLGGRYYGMRRYWKINATTAPTTNVEVMFPFLLKDTADVSGSVTAASPMSSYIFYKANSPIDPNPVSGFPGSATTDFVAYTYSTTASTNHWSFTNVGTTYLAHMLMTNLSGGGTGIFTACPALAAPTLSTSVTAPCTGTTNTFAVTPITGALSYNWSVTGTGWTGSSTSNSINLTTGTGVAVISVSANDTCGAGTAYTFTVTPSALPVITAITAPAPLCVGSSAGVFSTTATGLPVSYTWTVSGAGWSGSSTAATITPVVGSGTGTLMVQGTNACGTGAVFSVTVTPGTVPSAAVNIVAPATGPCIGSLVTYTTPSVAGATSYTWTITGTGWSGSSTTSSVNVTVGTGTGTITVTPVNDCGNGASFSLNGISPVAPPTASFSPSTLVTTTGTSITVMYTGAAPGGTTYSWTFPGGTPPSSTSPGPVSVYWNTPGTYTYTLTVDNDGCTATTTDTIHVNAATSISGVSLGKVNASIVPNPNDGSFDVVFDRAITSVVTVKLYDVLGRVVYKNDISASKNNKIAVTTTELPAGTYAATIYFEGNMIAEKVTITR